MQTASSFDVASAAVSEELAVHLRTISAEQLRLAQELATFRASAAVREGAEPATKKTKREEANAKKALCFNYDFFLGRKCEDPSLQFQDWLKEEQDKYHEIDEDLAFELAFEQECAFMLRPGAPMVSTERTPLPVVRPHESPQPPPLSSQTSQPEEQPEAYGSSWY